MFTPLRGRFHFFFTNIFFRGRNHHLGGSCSMMQGLWFWIFDSQGQAWIVVACSLFVQETKIQKKGSQGGVKTDMFRKVIFISLTDPIKTQREVFFLFDGCFLPHFRSLKWCRFHEVNEEERYSWVEKKALEKRFWRFVEKTV